MRRSTHQNFFVLCRVFQNMLQNVITFLEGKRKKTQKIEGERGGKTPQLRNSKEIEYFVTKPRR